MTAGKADRFLPTLLSLCISGLEMSPGLPACLQMLSHIDLSASDMLLAFSLAMVLQRKQRKQLRDQQEGRQRAGGEPGAAAIPGR